MGRRKTVWKRVSKRAAALLMAACMLMLAGCSGSGDQTSAGAEETTAQTTAAAETEAPTQEETTAEETEGTTASLEEQMDAYWNEELDGYLKNDAGYPHGKEGMGAVVLAMKDGEVIFEKAYGYAHYYDADYEAEGSTYANPVYVKTENPREMTTDTLFDLASITKVMATTQSIMILVDRGEISVDDKVADYLPGFEANGKGDITIAQLLTHSS